MAVAGKKEVAVALDEQVAVSCQGVAVSWVQQ